MCFLCMNVINIDTNSMNMDIKSTSQHIKTILIFSYNRNENRRIPNRKCNFTQYSKGNTYRRSRNGEISF